MFVEKPGGRDAPSSMIDGWSRSVSDLLLLSLFSLRMGVSALSSARWRSSCLLLVLSTMIHTKKPDNDVHLRYEL